MTIKEKTVEYRDDYEEYLEYKAERNRVRIPLILALFGLIFSVFFGLGGLFSVVSLVMSAIRYRAKKSVTLKWSIVISAVTIAICVVFVVALILAAVKARNIPIPEEVA